MKRLLIVMGKASEPGRVKTRLIPPLKAEQAARLNAAMMRATLRQVTHPDWAVELHLGGAARYGDGLATVPSVAQTGDGLGERMLAAATSGFTRGYDAVVLIGSDHPTVPPSHVEAAFRALDETEGVAIGPSEDGGYYLLGMTRPVPELFSDMVFSVNTVFIETMRRLDTLGLPVAVLPAWYDVDRAADLVRLRGDLLAAQKADLELLAVLEDIGP